jgi:hypothetical protein
MSRPCPNCGAESERGLPCPACGVSVIEIVRERLGISDSVGTGLNEVPRPFSPFVRSSTNYQWGPVRGSNINVDESGTLKGRMSGRPPRNEEGTQEAASILVSRLKERDGIPWSALQKPKHEHGVDWFATAGSQKLNIQITRPAPESLWRRLFSGEATLNESDFVQTAIQAIYDTINRKKYGTSTDIILGIAADLTPQYGSPAVAENFIALHGSWAASRGFQEIWLIGPTTHHCYRLDKD